MFLYVFSPLKREMKFTYLVAFKTVTVLYNHHLLPDPTDVLSNKLPWMLGVICSHVLTKLLQLPPDSLRSYGFRDLTCVIDFT